MRNIFPFLFLILMVSFFSCNDFEKKKTPQELKAELKDQELANPTFYIDLDSVYMQRNKIKEAGFFSSAKYDGYLITGIVKNKATVAKYKDLRLTVKLFSKTKTLISEDTYVFYEYYEPNTSKNFSIKINPPNAMKSFDVTVNNALGVRFE